MSYPDELFTESDSTQECPAKLMPLSSAQEGTHWKPQCSDMAFVAELLRKHA